MSVCAHIWARGQHWVYFFSHSPAYFWERIDGLPRKSRVFELSVPGFQGWLMGLPFYEGDGGLNLGSQACINSLPSWVISPTDIFNDYFIPKFQFYNPLIPRKRSNAGTKSHCVQSSLLSSLHWLESRDTVKSAGWTQRVDSGMSSFSRDSHGPCRSMYTHLMLNPIYPSHLTPLTNQTSCLQNVKMLVCSLLCIFLYDTQLILQLIYRLHSKQCWSLTDLIKS